MGISGVMQWWEQSQLRVLVLASLAMQYILFAIAGCRKLPINSWFRRFIWLAYLGSDALAIYALATLFNRHKKQDGDVSSTQLELLWAPILLIHLGGQDSITAYNMEDNELWSRRLFTVVSQVTVAIYVFSKSWLQGRDRRLQQAAILLFVNGILRCLEKTLALQNASINGIVSSARSFSSARSISSARFVVRTDNREVGSIDLEDFMQREASNTVEGSETPSLPNPTPSLSYPTPSLSNPYLLFADLAYPSRDRLRNKRIFSNLDGDAAYSVLNKEIKNMFDFLYTKQEVRRDDSSYTRANPLSSQMRIAFFVRATFMCIPWVAFGLFHHSHREDYNHVDVKVTYILLSLTALLVSISFHIKKVVLSTLWGVLTRFNIPTKCLRPSKSIDDKVSQYNFLAYCIRNKRYNKFLFILNIWNARDTFYQFWGMHSRSSSRSITALVHQHVKGWCCNNHIRDAPSYRMSNENRGQWTLRDEECSEILGWIVELAFDESVLIWHLVTDFCYYYKHASDQHGSPCAQDSSSHGLGHPDPVRCREMSNYMIYLLFMNPEMLIAGTRRNLVITAHEELNEIMRSEKYPLQEKALVQMISSKAKKELSQRESKALASPSIEYYGVDADGRTIRFIFDAWSIAEFLLKFPDDKMWRVIEGVWVEMLCFSAARSRGYLHAKGLATGVEYLTYVWLLLFYMGAETLAEKLQRAHYQNEGEHAADPSPASNGSRATSQEQAAGPPTPQDTGAMGDEQVAGPSTTEESDTTAGQEISGPWSCQDIRATWEDNV